MDEAFQESLSGNFDTIEHDAKAASEMAWNLDVPGMKTRLQSILYVGREIQRQLEQLEKEGKK